MYLEWKTVKSSLKKTLETESNRHLSELIHIWHHAAWRGGWN